METHSNKLNPKKLRGLFTFMSDVPVVNSERPESLLLAVLIQENHKNNLAPRVNIDEFIEELVFISG